MAAIQPKSPTELARMRQAGRLVAETLRLGADLAEPGVSTEQLDRAAADYIADQDGVPAFKGYRGFPGNICASINEEVVHGIPGPRKLKEGDLLKLDVGVLWDGYYADAALTVAVGDVSQEARRLMRATREALNAGISVLKAGVRVSEVSAAIEQFVRAEGFSVVTEYTGHGIGRALHEEPKVPNYVASRLTQRDVALPAGATVAIEPMVNQGTHRTRVLGNGWTVVTRDGKLSAHYEHTVAVEPTGAVILTLP
jgi:methionyl aminopeptidase